jgi:hypothetical protein
VNSRQRMGRGRMRLARRRRAASAGETAWTRRGKRGVPWVASGNGAAGDRPCPVSFSNTALVRQRGPERANRDNGGGLVITKGATLGHECPRPEDWEKEGSKQADEQNASNESCGHGAGINTAPLSLPAAQAAC